MRMKVMPNMAADNMIAGIDPGATASKAMEAAMARPAEPQPRPQAQVMHQVAGNGAAEPRDPENRPEYLAQMLAARDRVGNQLDREGPVDGGGQAKQ